MSKIMQLYNMSADEALQLSDAHVSFMLETAQTQAEQLASSSPQFQAALQQKLAPVKRAVRSVIEDNAASSGNGTVGAPPGL